MDGNLIANIDKSALSQQPTNAKGPMKNNKDKYKKNK